MSFKSYAQNFEDVMLWRALKHINKGVYIDIGAQDPIIDSVSMAFYEQGWRGIHIEPNVHYAQLLREHRPDEVVIQSAIGESDAVLTFYGIADTGLSTCDQTIANQHRTAGFPVSESSVPCITLAAVFKSMQQEIHWLKIDVEGFEEQVLRGWQPSDVRPWIVVIESTLPLTQIESHAKWEPLLLDKGYEFVYFDGLNRYYLSNNHFELKNAFRMGPNYFDAFVLSETTIYCAPLRHNLLVSQQEFDTQLTEKQINIEHLQQSLDHKEHIFNEQLIKKQMDIEHLQQAIEHKDHMFNEQLIKKEIDIDRLQQSLINSEHAFHEQLIKKKIDIDRLQQSLINSEHAFHEQLIRKQIEIDELQQLLEPTEHVLNEQLIKKQMNIEHLQQVLTHKELTFNEKLSSEQAEIHRLHQAIHAIYLTYSWRLTSPLRKIRPLISLVFKKFKQCIKKILTPILNAAIRFACVRPPLKRRLINWISRYPSVDQRLRLFAQEQGFIATPTYPLNSIDTDNPNSLQLTPAALKIYAQLNAAIEQYKKRTL